MRLLWLGSSNDVNPRVAENRRVPTIATRIIEETTGEEIELTVRAVWPSEEMPDLVERWTHRYEPDMVCLYVGSYYYSYRSVPLRVRRVLGPLGKPIASLGFRAADTKTLGESRAFHAMRSIALRTIGGDTHFTFDEVLDRTEASVRRVLAKEDTVVLVRAPNDEHPQSGRQPPHRTVTRRVEALAKKLHVSFLGWEVAQFVVGSSDVFFGDRVHFTEEAQAAMGAELGEALAAAWLAAHPAGASTQ